MSKAEFDITKIEADYAVKRGAEALDNVIKTLTSAAREIASYKERFDGEEDLAEKAQRLNWAISHVASNILGNCRLDMVASAQAELVRVAQSQKGGTQ